MPDAQSRAAVYLPWVDRPVALRVIAGTVKTVFHCTILGESKAAVRIRVKGITSADVWDVDIYKDMILHVESAAPLPILQPFNRNSEYNGF